ncbi:DUF6264 family protein [Microterricola viridarii]|uniref:Uncharacterized protein n=1 Tax=Microterricola viridarii TaxID=412690 RepID=A0A0X8E2T8_9MICO|nr:DUF6264 family protein [Microterricola viridarii]AMB59048.1 hypothetical protein AWU67_09480 [Microterricola viridarii]
MSENEAAATPDTSRGGERPRPRYGELAPEGWSWQPPAPPEQAEAEPTPAAPAVPVAPRNPVPPAPPAPLGSPAFGAPGQAAPSLRADRRLTITLLVVGLFGLWVAISTLNSIPEAMQILHSQQGLADYVASEADMRSILIGNVLQGILWVATAAWAVLRMQHGKRSFWVPLIGGAASVILLFAVVSMVAANDPLLMQLGGGN